MQTTSEYIDKVPLLCLWDASWFDISINHGACAQLEPESELIAQLAVWARDIYTATKEGAMDWLPLKGTTAEIRVE